MSKFMGPGAGIGLEQNLSWQRYLQQNLIWRKTHPGGWLWGYWNCSGDRNCPRGARRYYGGKIDNVIMRILDVFMAVPNLVLAIALACALWGRGQSRCVRGIPVRPHYAI